MNRVPAIALAVAAGACFSMAQAQYSARSVTPKVTGVTTATGTGGYLQGADDCSTPHTNIGTGTLSGIPFTTGTTGTTGQNEANCYQFGTSGVNNDVWFDWTADGSGNSVRYETCNGTGVDTKIAAYPDNSPAGCPANGTSLACTDDACGLQSSISWSVTAGSTYTLQLGTFPGAAGGSGTFSMTQFAPPACGQYDDGVTENSLGLTAGGEMGWIHVFTCGLTKVDTISTAYGTTLFPGSVTNGSNSTIVLYDAPAGTTDPNSITAGNVLASVNTTVVNGDTDILNPISVGHNNLTPSHVTMIMATADQVAGQFPGPMDQTNPTPNAWVVGSTLGPGTLDTNTLANNNVPPLQMQAIGFPAAWLLRAENTTGTGGGPGTPICFGDGTGAPCGCGNTGPAGGGCLNSLGVGGILASTGTADTTADTVALTSSNVRSQPGLFFQGDNAIGGGTGATFGDGIRCCGQNVVRLQVVVPPPPEPATGNLTVTISTHAPAGTVNPGDTKCYQYWYRDPGASPCGSTFNLTNAVTITWS